jgi:acyl carrier protein
VITGVEHDQYAMWRVVVRALRSVFPYIDIEEINRFEPLADEIDSTSDDFTQLMAAITEEIGVVVPEEDYPLVTTLDGLEQYLNLRVSSPASRAGAMNLPT